MIGVIGGANMDILGQVDKRMLEGEDNPGRIRFCPGGMGRNIVETLCRLGASAAFFSAVGEDPLSNTLLEELRALGADTSPCLQMKGESAPVYMAIHDGMGEMVMGIDDTAISQALDRKALLSQVQTIRGWDFVVLDAVRALDEKYRDIVFLYYYEGYGTNEIADMLEMRKGTVESRLFRAREQLKKTLEGDWN